MDTKEFIEIRNKVIKRDDGKCTECGAPGDIVVILPEFRIRKAQGKPVRMKDLKTVCPHCLHTMREPRGNNVRMMIATNGFVDVIELA